MGADEQVPFANYQYEIYLAGLSGQLPSLPIAAGELEERARQSLTPEAYGYVAGGAGSEDTMRENLAAFRRWRIVPRMLRDVSTRDLRTTVLGTDLDIPVVLPPIGVQSIVHPEGELAVARAAAAAGVPMILSTASSHSIEEIAGAMGDATRWFQLYRPNDPELCASFLQRAERAGFSALVVTLDTTALAWRPRDLQLAYLPFLKSEGIANYLSDPVFRAALAAPPEEDPQAAVMRFGQGFSDPSVTWDDLGFLREHTSVPIVLKGILSAEDARRAAHAGMDGVVVSNHGGRQVDGSIASLDALPEVVEAVGDELAVLLDSGVRTGSDVFKALALGADAVGVGRTWMYALALEGEQGVHTFLRSLLAEVDLAFALSGRTTLAELDPGALRRVR